MKIRLKLRSDKKPIEFNNVEKVFLDNGFLLIARRINKLRRIDPVNLQDINYYEII